MENLARVFPFLWPYRRKIILSTVFALLTALLWGANLSVAFPVVKVLLQGQSLAGYVTSEIEIVETEIADRTNQLKQLDSQIDLLKEQGGQTDDDKFVKLLTAQARQQKKLSLASRSLLLMNWLKSYVMPWVPRDQFDTFALIMGILILATALKGIAIFTQDVLIGSVVELTVMGIRKECFRKTLALDYQTLAMNGTADLMSRFTNDINVMANGLLLLGGKVIREPLKAIMCVVLAFMVNWQLTLLSLLFIPLMGLVFYRYGKMLKQASHRMMESMSRIYKSLEETFDAFKVVIAFDAARRHKVRFHHENKEYYHKAMKVVQIDALTSPTTELMGLFAVFVALLPGAYLVLRGTTSIWGIRLAAEPMDIATLSVLYAFLAGVLDPVRKLSSIYSKLKRSAAATERVFALIDRRSLVEQNKQPKLMPRHQKSVTFQNVTFSYAGRDEYGQQRPAALDSVDLDVAAGEVIAVVGENGSGKSTLVNLLPRFYDCDSGAVLIDDIDIRDVSLRDLRAQIGVVTQETLLFDDTIYENIRYGKFNATREEIERAAEKAHVLPFLDELPDGFKTHVGEKGQRLSGGQRQRIALARAILRDPAILVLDEATSAIDAQSEYLIHQALRDFVKGRTTFIITHSVSPSILDLVTQIAVMDQGRLIAVGTHGHLIQSCPIYKNLFEAQQHQRSANGIGDDSKILDPATDYSQHRSSAQTEQDDLSDQNNDAQNKPDIIPFISGRFVQRKSNEPTTNPDSPAPDGTHG